MDDKATRWLSWTWSTWFRLGFLPREGGGVREGEDGEVVGEEGEGEGSGGGRPSVEAAAECLIYFISGPLSG